MRQSIRALLAAISLTLAACVKPVALQLSDDHPASTKAPAGTIDTPTAIGDYKTPQEFAARAAADANAPESEHMHHGMGSMRDMSSMHHGGMSHEHAAPDGGSQ